MQKTISVIMSNYNHANYIGEALNAILAQSFYPSDVIVVDDGSTDDSIKVIKKIAEHDPIIRLFCTRRNMGAVYSQNLALSNSKSDYVYPAAADDKVLPGFLEKSMAMLVRYPQAGLCCSDPVTFEDYSGSVKKHRLRLSDSPRYFSPDEVVMLSRKKNFWIACHASVVKRSALKEAGGLITNLQWYCDWFALLVISFRYGICYIPESLASLRVSKASYSALGTKQKDTQMEVIRTMLEILKSSNYHDVFSKFKHTAVLSCFGMASLRVILNNLKHKDFLTPLLLKRIMWSETKRVIHKRITQIVKKYIKRCDLDNS
jgi:glycosyltransferase involved in cell wall biosynthesis